MVDTGPRLSRAMGDASKLAQMRGFTYHDLPPPPIMAPFQAGKWQGNDKKRTDKDNFIIYLEPICPLFWGFNPPKQGLFQSKQGSFGFQVFNVSRQHHDDYQKKFDHHFFGGDVHYDSRRDEYSS